MNETSIELDERVQEAEGRSRVLSGWRLHTVALIAFIWSLFQLWYASPLPFILDFGKIGSFEHDQAFHHQSG